MRQLSGVAALARAGLGLLALLGLALAAGHLAPADAWLIQGSRCGGTAIDVWDISYGLGSGTTTTSTSSSSPIAGKGVLCHYTGKWVYEASKSLTNSNYGFGFITAGQDSTKVLGDTQTASCPASTHGSPYWCSVAALNTGAGNKYAEWNFAGSRNPVVPNPALPVANSDHFRFAIHLNVTPTNHLMWWQDLTADPSTWYGGSVGVADPATDTNGFAFSFTAGTAVFIGVSCTVACGAISMFPHATQYADYLPWQLHP